MTSFQIFAWESFPQYDLGRSCRIVAKLPLFGPGFTCKQATKLSKKDIEQSALETGSYSTEKVASFHGSVHLVICPKKHTFRGLVWSHSEGFGKV